MTDAMPASSTLRLLDANANRSQEGLRVVEDFLRFVTNDADLAAQCKTIRHRIITTLHQCVPPHDLIAARDTANDVGRETKTASELTREGSAAVVTANLKRAQQALRVLEEWAKTIAPACGSEFEQLRYTTYELESAIERRLPADDWLYEAWLYVLIDSGKTEDDFRRRLDVLLKSEVCVIQLRDKREETCYSFKLAEIARQQTRGTRTRFIMNDRADIAAAVGADGVHVGQSDLPVAAARRIVGPEAVVGLSTHSIDQASAASLAGADYIGVGPTFRSQTKSFDEHPGTQLLARVAENVHLPSFAIGGIQPSNLGEVLATGMSRVAVSQAVWGSESPATAIRNLRQARSEADAARQGDFN